MHFAMSFYSYFPRVHRCVRDCRLWNILPQSHRKVIGKNVSFTGAVCLKTSGQSSVRTAKVAAVAQAKLNFINTAQTGDGLLL